MRQLEIANTLLFTYIYILFELRKIKAVTTVFLANAHQLRGGTLTRKLRIQRGA